MINLSNYGIQANGRWVVADLHVHSSFSGGSLIPQELLVMAGTQLLDVVAITDHYQVQGAITAEKFTKANPSMPLVIVSQEISLGDHFHLLVHGSKESWEGQHRKTLLEKLYDHHRNGGAVILAHPWTIPKTSWAADCLRSLLQDKVIDGAELFNSSILDFVDQAEFKLRSVWEELIIPHQLAIVGGSDYHYHRQGRQIGAGRTYLWVNSPGVSGIMEALRNRRTVAGLFSYRPFQAGNFGTGYRLIFGNEPWYGELRSLITKSEQRIALIRSSRNGRDRRRWLSALMAAGQYQGVWDFLEGK